MFGACAGEAAAKAFKGKTPPRWDAATAAPQIDIIRRVKARGRNKPKGEAPTRMFGELKEMMWTKVGAFRTGEDLIAARERIRAMCEGEIDELSVGPDTVHNASLVEWFELHNGLQAAETVVVAGLNRRESRGAHQRLDFPQSLDGYQLNQHIALRDGKITSSFEGLRL